MTAKIADIPPAACAVCFQHYTYDRHVDFGAAYDGPVLTLEDGRKQPIDDLVICEKCLSEAFALLDPQGLHQTIRVHEQIQEALEDDIQAKDRMIARLEKTVSELVDHPIKPLAGTQHYAGLKQEDAKELRDNAATRKKNSDRAKAAAK